MATKTKYINMTEGPVFLNLIKYAIPGMINGMVSILYGAADTAILGIFGNRQAMAGVGATGSLYSMILALFLGYIGGVSIIVGRAVGKKDKNEVHEVVHTAIASCLMFGVVIAILGISFAVPLLRLTAVPDNVMNEAWTYIVIVFCGIPFTLVTRCISDILCASGDTKRPMIISLSMGALNVLLNVVFVALLDMKAAGVAFATLACNLIGAACSVILLARENSDVKLYLKKMKIYKKWFWQIIKVGFPMGFQTLIFSFSNVIVQSSVNSFGDAAIAGNTSGGSVANFFYIELNAIATASTAFVSQNYGARNAGRIKKVISYAVYTVIGIWAVTALIAVFFGKPLLWLYTPGDTATINYGYEKLLLVGAFYGLCGLSEIVTGAIRAIGYSVTPTVFSIIGVCGLRVLWIYTGFALIGSFASLFVCYPISWLFTFLASGAVLVFGYAKLKKEFALDKI